MHAVSQEGEAVISFILGVWMPNIECKNLLYFLVEVKMSFVVNRGDKQYLKKGSLMKITKNDFVGLRVFLRKSIKTVYK